MGVLGPHDDGLGRHSGLDRPEVRLGALLDEVGYRRGLHHGVAVLLRVLLLRCVAQPTLISRSLAFTRSTRLDL